MYNDSLDIGDDINMFFKDFGIKKLLPVKSIKLWQREALEAIITHKLVVGLTEDDFPDYYTLNYIGDMWYGCELCKTIKVNKEYYTETLYRGEGDTTTLALLALLILLKKCKILDGTEISEIRSVFN